MEPRWHTKAELTGSVAFYCSDDEGYDRLATDWKKGQWYWTLDQENFFGPYSNRLLAARGCRQARDAKDAQ